MLKIGEGCYVWKNSLFEYARFIGRRGENRFILSLFFVIKKKVRWKLLILSLFQAAALLHDVSLGITMELTIVRIIRMLVQENEVCVYVCVYIDWNVLNCYY